MKSDFYDLYRPTFEKNELGRIKVKLSSHEMALKFGGSSESMRPQLEREPFIAPDGKATLVFLKMHMGLSCPRLMVQLNGNIHYQMFCGVMIDPIHHMQDYNLLTILSMNLRRT